MLRSFLLFLLTGFLSIGFASVGRTHGGRIEQKAAEAIVLETFENSGAPMSGAIVAIYTPQDSVTPWKTGTTDAQGQFIFIPDRSQPGEWTAQIRFAGHGHTIPIPIPPEIPPETAAAPVPGNAPDSKDTAKTHENLAPVESTSTEAISQTIAPPLSPPLSPPVSSASSSPAILPNTPLQQGLLVGSVLWGFVGTGLFFSRR